MLGPPVGLRYRLLRPDRRHKLHAGSRRPLQQVFLKLGRGSQLCPGPPARLALPRQTERPPRRVGQPTVTHRLALRADRRRRRGQRQRRRLGVPFNGSRRPPAEQLNDGHGDAHRGAGAYRSAKEYFLAAFRYQEHDLRLEVDPLLLRRFANRVIKAIVRGLPISRLKEAFPLPALAPLVSFADRAAFDPWFMLRKIEVAAARVGDMVVSPGLVVLDLPLRRREDRRSLRCACGAATHPLCPVHAAMRHMVRLGAAGWVTSTSPLFPGSERRRRSPPRSWARY